MSIPKTKLWQKLLLAFSGPLLFFVVVEGACRALNLPGRLREAVSGTAIEMPRWITSSDRADSIRAHLSQHKTSLSWMRLFRPGRGFRVHLEPNRAEKITNTFSLISADSEKQYELHSNALGFRGKDLSETKQPGTVRVLIFGDSSSFGWGVDEEDTYAAVLERTLERQLGTNVEVGNFAMPGDSSEFGRLIAEKMLPRFAPDFVIFGFGANDATLTYTPHQTQIDRFRGSGVLQDMRSLLQESAFIGTLTALADRSKSAPRRTNAEKVVAVPLERYRANISSLVQLAERGGAKKSLVFTICVPKDYRLSAEAAAAERSAAFFDGQKYLTSRIPAIKGGEILPDLVQEMRASYGGDLAKNDSFYITNDGCHPNKLGYRILGEELANLILPEARQVADRFSASEKGQPVVD